MFQFVNNKLINNHYKENAMIKKTATPLEEMEELYAKENVAYRAVCSGVYIVLGILAVEKILSIIKASQEQEAEKIILRLLFGFMLTMMLSPLPPSVTMKLKHSGSFQKFILSLLFFIISHLILILVLIYHHKI